VFTIHKNNKNSEGPKKLEELPKIIHFYWNFFVISLASLLKQLNNIWISASNKKWLKSRL
jgi:hypothetical protein